VSNLIRGRRIVGDEWVFAGDAAALPERGDVLVPLALWKAEREALLRHDGRLGVLLAPADEPAEIAADLPRLALVAVDFPQAADGRGYSTARLLRERHGYTGELRAVGEVLVDMLPLLQRTGFDAAQLRRDQRVEAAVRALGFFPGHYQGDVQQPRPAFARDLAAEIAAPRNPSELFAGQGI